MTTPALRPAIFLDRDGTVNEDVSYLNSPEQLRLLPGAAEGLRRLQEHFALVVVTNQSGIARGLLSEKSLLQIHQKLDAMLAAHGVKLDAYYICPHHPDHGEPPYRQDCSCRKPKTGLYERAAAEMGLDLAASWAVGDRLRDCVGPMSLGCRAILLGDAETQAGLAQAYPGLVILPGLDAAADHILKHS